VGFVLGVIGGGGSILAVPLLVYVVGVKSPHIAIGTSALAVAASAFANLLDHARRGHVCWPAALWFAAAGVGGTVIGSTLGKHTDGQKLLMLFGLMMIGIAATMARKKVEETGQSVKANEIRIPLLLGIGAIVGILAGFFGIGGGFLVVPGLLAATAMPLITAIGSSLVSVTAFGLSTAASYAVSGLIDWGLAGLFICGGIAGGLAGGRLAAFLAPKKRALSLIFAAVVATVGLYVTIRGIINLVGQDSVAAWPHSAG